MLMPSLRKETDAVMKKRKMIEEFEHLEDGLDGERPRYLGGVPPTRASYGKSILSEVEVSADSLSPHVRET